MKKLLLGGLTLMLTASALTAADGHPLRSALSRSLVPALLGQSETVSTPQVLSPVPDPAYSSTGYPVVSQPIQLFPDVRYRAVRNIAPCAVPTIIQVADPCDKSCCGKSCVNIQVCVPPCDPQQVKVTRDGDRVRYDYGKFAVTARTVGDHIVVHYHD